MGYSTVNVQLVIAICYPNILINLIQKVDDDLDTRISFKNSYVSNFLMDQMLASITDESSIAIVLLNNNSIIQYINEKAYTLLQKKSGDTLTASDLPLDKFFEVPHYKDELVSIKNSNYLLSKKQLTISSEPIGFFLTLQNEKDLRDSGDSLSKQLHTRGYYAKYNFDSILYQSDEMKECIDISKRISSSDYTVLISGESGTGKELIAQSIHNYSSRNKQPFVAVNCTVLPENLLESELFGYEPGAFTGARKDGKIGLFEQAQNGTIFLDEIGSLPLKMQARLLRVIQEKQIMRIGSDKIVDVDVRIIAATNANLQQMIEEGRFRDDLFYRLNVISVIVPPLRNRTDDVLLLLHHFLGKQFHHLTPKELEILQRYSWPGNVRELENFSSYYRMLQKIPSYYYEFESSGHCKSLESDTMRIGSSITSDYLTLKKMILKILAESNTITLGMGRGTLKNELKERGIIIGEGIIRKLLNELQENGYVVIRRGRTGTQITKYGLQELET